MSTLPRVRAPERMDAPDVDPRELARSLDDLRGVNRWLGGTRAALAEIVPMLRHFALARARVLDVATGSGDIPVELARWGRRSGTPVEVVATDLHARTVEAARARVDDPDVRVERADALDLPYPDLAFDVAMCHTALHHFDPAEAVAVLGELGRVAARGVVVTDLRRSRAGLLGARLLAATVWRRHPVTRHDGPRSVRAAYTSDELRALAEEAGLEGARVRRRPVFRLSLCWLRPEAT
ncbi:MAG TPA: methyltransferase domain-containing protein [Longimicrobiaceae bacterium]|nr:methyltransferase domain-containing protein [Longimicrobiaceae bacterium]